jgi:hypothetical protein
MNNFITSRGGSTVDRGFMVADTHEPEDDLAIVTAEGASMLASWVFWLCGALCVALWAGLTAYVLYVYH